ncbi:MAG: hypothetical protein ABFR31_09765, partial [Thermodesulfobacteriota bacterium]
MENTYQTISLASLALQYGTINEEQYSNVNRLYALRQKEGVDFEQLLLTGKLATQYQIELLKLIQEYLIIKEQGEEFGRIAMEKGLATKAEVDKALDCQKKEFKRAKIKKLVGDILVESKVITIKQKNMILKEQNFIDEDVQKIQVSDDSNKDDINLSKYEKQFLRIKVLDQEFAASVVEKGLASEEETRIAQKIQEEEFEKENIIRILGDIMVELEFLTQGQKDFVLKEQKCIQSIEQRESDPAIQLNISQDQMEAVITIKDYFSDIALKDIKHALDVKGVKYGRYSDAILQCNLDQNNKKFVVAKLGLPLELIKTVQASYYFTTDKIDTEIKNRGEILAEQHFRGGSSIKKDLFGDNVEQSAGNGFAFRC